MQRDLKNATHDLLTSYIHLEFQNDTLAKLILPDTYVKRIEFLRNLSLRTIVGVANLSALLTEIPENEFNKRIQFHNPILHIHHNTFF